MAPWAQRLASVWMNLSGLAVVPRPMRTGEEMGHAPPGRFLSELSGGFGGCKRMRPPRPILFSHLETAESARVMIASISARSSRKRRRAAIALTPVGGQLGQVAPSGPSCNRAGVSSLLLFPAASHLVAPASNLLQENLRADARVWSFIRVLLVGGWVARPAFRETRTKSLARNYI